MVVVSLDSFIMKTRKIGLNLIVQVAIKFVAVILAIFTTRWLISNVESSELANYNVGLAFVSVIISIVHAGIPNIIQKFYTNESDKADIGVFWSTFALIRGVSYFIGLFLIVIFYRITGVENLGLLASIYSIMWLLTADLSYRSICDALAKTWQFNLTDVLSRVLILLAISGYTLFRVQLYSPLNFFIAASGMSYFAGLMADAIWQRKHVVWKKPTLSMLKIYLPSLTFLWISAVCVALFTTTDKLFLRYFGYSDEIINGYSNAYKLFETAGIIPGIAMPTVASLVKKKLDLLQESTLSIYLKQKLKLGVRLSILLEWVLYTLVIAMIICVFVVVISPLLIRLIDKDLKYPLALSSAPIILLALAPLFFIYLFSLLTMFMNGEKYEMYGTMIILFFTTILYVTLIPRFGIVGASFATLGGFVVDLCVKIYFFSKSFGEYSKLTKAKDN